MDNSALAEMLAVEGEDATGFLRRAYRRAARMAFLWPDEARDLLAAGRSLTELAGIGPFLEKRLCAWLEKPPVIIEPPEIRRNFLSVPQANFLLKNSPLWRESVRGDLQMHTEWSDGSGRIIDMAIAAEQRGYEYIAITDHAQGLKIAGGISPAELEEQGREIDAVNETLAAQNQKVRVLKSIELNLSPNGKGDLPDPDTAKLDIVLGCFHSALRKTEPQTERYLAAVANPAIQILGHPRGRIYNYRLGLTADWSRVFAAATAADKAVEIDCYPDRQDLSRDLLQIARQEGTRISLGTDAHHPWQLEFLVLGLAAAKEAKIPRERIINFLSRDELRAWVAQVRSL